jgi:large subunit ribosomal protein L15
MKLHDLRPAEGSRKERTRVGRGIAAGKGKTAGRGTKGQKARAGGSIPAWFEGGQTPLHMRIPKLRGFKNPFRIEFEVVNVGAIAAAVERGAFDGAESPAPKGKGKAAAQLTINQDLLRAAGLVRTLNKPLKVLGNGEVSTALFVVADAFTASARAKIEAAGGTVSVLEVPSRPMKAIGVDASTEAPSEPAEAAPLADADPAADAAPTANATAEAATTDSGTDEEPPTEAGAEAVLPTDETASTDASSESDPAETASGENA